MDSAPGLSAGPRKNDVRVVRAEALKSIYFTSLNRSASKPGSSARRPLGAAKRLPKRGARGGVGYVLFVLGGCGLAVRHLHFPLQESAVGDTDYLCLDIALDPTR